MQENAIPECILSTTGAPVKLTLRADRDEILASRNDLAYVTVEAAEGRRVPDAKAEAHFAVEGAGDLAVQGNGVPNEPASFQAPVCRTRLGVAWRSFDPRAGRARLLSTPKPRASPRPKSRFKPVSRPEHVRPLQGRTKSKAP